MSPVTVCFEVCNLKFVCLMQFRGIGEAARVKAACCRLDNFEGELQLDEDEVQDTKWQHLTDLYKEVEAEPDSFTSWLRAEVGMLRGVLEGRSTIKDQIPCYPEDPSVQLALA